MTVKPNLLSLDSYRELADQDTNDPLHDRSMAIDTADVRPAQLAYFDPEAAQARLDREAAGDAHDR